MGGEKLHSDGFLRNDWIQPKWAMDPQNKRQINVCYGGEMMIRNKNTLDKEISLGKQTSGQV